MRDMLECNILISRVVSLPHLQHLFNKSGISYFILKCVTFYSDYVEYKLIYLRLM